MTEIGEKPERRYYALIADVVASRELPAREEVQKVLRARLDAWTERLDRALVAPLALTAGDEFEGLFHEPAPMVEVSRDISDALHPTQLAIGFGLGTLSTSIPRRRADRRVAELDGSVFHHARAALQAAKDSPSWLAVRGWGSSDELLSALGEMIGVQRSGWTIKQARYCQAAREDVQKDVAARFGVSPSVVSESLKAASFEPVRRAELALAHGLERLLPDSGVLEVEP